MPKTGFCTAGHHEGGRYPGPSGKFNKTCTFPDVCSCDDPTCHRFFDKMFSEAGMPRQVVDNSGYESETHSFLAPVPTVLAAPPILSNSRPVVDAQTLESVAPGRVPPVRRASYGPTSSGRAARGQLEAQVNTVCTTWVIEEEKVLCTPAYISEEIAKAEGIKAPSTGAIDAVFGRWERYGYAVIGRKPTRFLQFTEEGVEHGLEYLKDKSKRQDKSHQAAMSRGER